MRYEAGKMPVASFFSGPYTRFYMGRLTGERRALSAAVFAFYAFLFLLVALQPPPGWGPCFLGMAIAYGLGFFGLVAGYFWARWYAIGLGISGIISAGVSLWQVGMEPVLLFYGGTHLGACAVLWGTGMAASFDGRKEWRDRFHLDEAATHRLGKAIIRVGVSLPYVIMYALAPKEQMGAALLGLLAATLTASGVWALFRLRTWGLLALASVGVLVLTTLSSVEMLASFGQGYALNLWLTGVGACTFLVLGLAPFMRPALAYLRGR
jgi:hypothetical protein